MNKEVEYLKEHLYEIYKYKKSMKDLTYDMDLEHLLRTCKALDYLQQELDKYKNIVDELEKFLQEDVVYTSNTKADFISGILEANRLALNKLKELKGE